MKVKFGFFSCVLASIILFILASQFMYSYVVEFKNLKTIFIETEANVIDYSKYLEFRRKGRVVVYKYYSIYSYVDDDGNEYKLEDANYYRTPPIIGSINKIYLNPENPTYCYSKPETVLKDLLTVPTLTFGFSLISFLKAIELTKKSTKKTMKN